MKTLDQIKPDERVCFNCKFGVYNEESKQVICHFMPPHPAVLQVPNPRAQLDPKQPAFAMVSQSLFVAVAPDWWCGKYQKSTVAGNL